MIDFKLNQAKTMFFDRAAVINAVDAASKKVLSRFGAFVRTAARSSIRKRRKSSAPGSPPSGHTGLLKKFIFFGYDTTSHSVVAGPVRLNAKSKFIVPEALEHGGQTNVVSYASKKKTTRVVDISARPFMAPALQKELPKLPAMWRDSVRN